MRVVVPVVVLVGRLSVSCPVTLVGGVMPRSSSLSRRTCSTATSTTTSGLALSISLMIFSASATWSGVPRTTIAPCEGNCWMRLISTSVRMAFTVSCSSVGAEMLVR